MANTNKKPATTKTATVCRLLSRPRGAMVEEIMTATSWQNHSVRSFLTGLRKKGCTLVREERTSGELAYRLTDGEHLLTDHAIERGPRGSAPSYSIAAS